MARIAFVFGALGLILAAFFGITAAGYGLGGWIDSVWFPGAHRLTNIVILMLVFVMVTATLLTAAERKWSALMQNRIGPNRAKLFGSPLAGLGHTAADVLKMLTKEDFIPAKANKLLFSLAPMLAFAPIFVLFAVVPAGPSLQVLGNHDRHGRGHARLRHPLRLRHQLAGRVRHGARRLVLATTSSACSAASAPPRR